MQTRSSAEREGTAGVKAAGSDLAEVVSAAFPPDRPCGGPGADAALERALRTVGPAVRAGALAEADRIARRGLCEVQLDALIAYELGSHLTPADLGLTPAAWLDWLRSGIERAVAAGDAGADLRGAPTHG